ncbi:MAG: hypothetical protein ACK5NT_15325 [Pyrinomonadaceae bacterium]
MDLRQIPIYVKSNKTRDSVLISFKFDSIRMKANLALLGAE